jgi:hypothetical protein
MVMIDHANINPVDYAKEEVLVSSVDWGWRVSRSLKLLAERLLLNYANDSINEKLQNKILREIQKKDGLIKDSALFKAMRKYTPKQIDDALKFMIKSDLIELCKKGDQYLYREKIEKLG